MKKKENKVCDFCLEDMKKDGNHLDECADFCHYVAPKKKRKLTPPQKPE